IPFNLCIFMSQKNPHQLSSGITGSSNDSCFYHILNLFSLSSAADSSFPAVVCVHHTPVLLPMQEKIMHIFSKILNNYTSSFIHMQEKFFYFLGSLPYAYTINRYWDMPENHIPLVYSKNKDIL